MLPLRETSLIYEPRYFMTLMLTAHAADDYVTAFSGCGWIYDDNAWH